MGLIFKIASVLTLNTEIPTEQQSICTSAHCYNLAQATILSYLFHILWLCYEIEVHFVWLFSPISPLVHLTRNHSHELVYIFLVYVFTLYIDPSISYDIAFLCFQVYVNGAMLNENYTVLFT